LPVYDVAVNNRTFRVEVEEISRNRFRVIINGKEEIIELSEKAKEVLRKREDEKQSVAREGGEIRAEMSGSIVRVLVKKGERVERGQAVLVLEAMKMENEVTSPYSGVVEEVLVSDGDKVQAGDVLLVISENEQPDSDVQMKTSTSSEDGNVVRAEMAGTVVKVLKREGETVRAGEAVLVLEAMKMENEISSPSDGKLSRIFVGEGSRVQIGDPLFSLS